MTLFQVFPFLSSGGFISHVPECTLHVSYCEPYIAFITQISTFLLATDCVVPSFCNATNCDSQTHYDTQKVVHGEDNLQVISTFLQLSQKGP